MTALYRHFANDGSLLYVGISLSWPARTKAHSRGSHWFEQVSRVEIEQFPTREAALDAERAAIKAERPKFNVIHNRGGEAKRVERPKARRRTGDVLLDNVTGPDAIVGPALLYREDKISVVVAHGTAGSPGVLDEFVLGEYVPDPPEWAMRHCATVLTMKRGDQVSMDDARRMRRDIIAKLRANLRSVESYNTDIAFAVANASRFPSVKARQVLNDIANEKGVAA